ncbi:hypothetical protein QE250_17105, partial [Chromatiaceae bacterium AAb-1]|nr:hypothetical protein [Chromatiaceae bacterium AAb-1]
MKIFYLFLAIFSFNLWSVEIKSGWTKIEQLYPTSEGLAFITSYKNTEVSSCNDGGRFSLNPDNRDYNVQASALMAAFMGEKQVSLYILQKPVQCYGV